MTSRPVFEAEHEAFRDSVRRFLATEPAEFAKAAAEYGFIGLGASDVQDARFAAVVLEEAMTAGRPAVALCLAMHDGFALPLVGDRAVAGLAGVVDPDEAFLTAQPREDGWVLTGNAQIVLNGLGADLFVVGARTDDGSARLFVVEGAASGLQRAPADELLGLDDLDVADLRFDSVPATELSGGDLSAARARHQLALAVAAMAGARTALATTVDYVHQRKAFGRPIAEFENTRHALSRLGARVTATTAFVDSCLVVPLTPELAATAKLCATDVLTEAVDTGVQLHGGYGYMWEYPIARAYAAARFFRVHGDAGEHLDRVLAGAIGL